MSDEKIRVDMSRHQRPYTRGPQARKNILDEFSREFPGAEIPGGDEEAYDAMESRLRALAESRKAAKGGD
jgi:hypothetical protein